MAKAEILNFLKKYLTRNKKRYRITRLGVFGSAARDQLMAQSDIDIKQDIEEAMKRHVDIVRFRSRMNPFLKKRIEKEAVYV